MYIFVPAITFVNFLMCSINYVWIVLILISWLKVLLIIAVSSRHYLIKRNILTNNFEKINYSYNFALLIIIMNMVFSKKDFINKLLFKNFKKIP
jgi:hypothetical protein